MLARRLNRKSIEEKKINLIDVTTELSSTAINLVFLHAKMNINRKFKQDGVGAP